MEWKLLCLQMLTWLYLLVNCHFTTDFCNQKNQLWIVCVVIATTMTCLYGMFFLSGWKWTEFIFYFQPEPNVLGWAVLLAPWTKTSHLDRGEHVGIQFIYAHFFIWLLSFVCPHDRVYRCVATSIATCRIFFKMYIGFPLSYIQTFSILPYVRGWRYYF